MIGRMGAPDFSGVTTAQFDAFIWKQAQSLTPAEREHMKASCADPSIPKNSGGQHVCDVLFPPTPSWVLPVAIVGGVAILGGIAYVMLKRRRR